MAYIYYAAITRALRAGKVKEAADMEQTGSVNCDKVRGNGVFSRKFHGAPSSIYVWVRGTDNRPPTTANTQRGSGQGNGIYQHFSSEQGVSLPHLITVLLYSAHAHLEQVILEIESPWDRNQWRWARLFSRKYDDLLGWYDYETNDHRFGVWYVPPSLATLPSVHAVLESKADKRVQEEFGQRCRRIHTHRRSPWEHILYSPRASLRRRGR